MTAAVPALGSLRLHAGQEVHARVLSSPAHGPGSGRLALAGHQVAVTLPAGLQAGQRLTLRVASISTRRVVFEPVISQPATRPLAALPPSAQAVRHAQHLAGSLLLDGDPRLAAAALALVRAAQQAANDPVTAYLPNGRGNGAEADELPAQPANPGLAESPLGMILVELPGGRRVQFDRRNPRAAAADEPQQLSFVLHGHVLGPLGVHLLSDRQRLHVTLTATTDAVEELSATQSQLLARLQARLGDAVSITLRQRVEDEPAPVDPQELDVYG